MEANILFERHRISLLPHDGGLQKLVQRAKHYLKERNNENKLFKPVGIV